MEMTPLFATFGLVALAELGDKTQLTVIALSTMYDRRKVFSGVILAFFLVTGAGVLIGDALYQLVDHHLIRLTAGVLFLVFGVWMLRSKAYCDTNTGSLLCNPLISTFSMISVAEIGDKTQLSAMTLSAKFHEPHLVFLGAFLALAAVSLAGIFAGEKLMGMVPLSKVKTVAGVMFIFFGLLFLAGF